jgi:hypothetical protein
MLAHIHLALHHLAGHTEAQARFDAGAHLAGIFQHRRGLRLPTVTSLTARTGSSAAGLGEQPTSDSAATTPTSTPDTGMRTTAEDFMGFPTRKITD